MARPKHSTVRVVRNGGVSLSTDDRTAKADRRGDAGISDGEWAAASLSEVLTAFA
ncbi:hypothetical protein [Brucella intermedia]|uniref:hypothetical protein n=1 Tax=Brucella intermedia TaxID=94625 RepID=UPI000A6598ED|nr:hypothetical protein [Brucella intermedia]MDL2205159.1 hypothetical protein [Brucella intermedia]QNQ42440.1 hypothetical protein IAR37_22725 [Brucella intermedia]